ncbi:glycosyltransferase family 2 protein [Williamsia sp. DF01-3]|uniref:glycosyltransferase n=1 Tax=Williamsia sp. DF01-3 TaxID=2934157 RepID=UPI001FF4FEE7|nr:glycosyltransferase [Williamsia sp. DF01-3]MCK0515727.1 glycosyltransferase [Williamsia sp. DF01-3]
MATEVSVVVPVHNEESTIVACLNHLVAQTHPIAEIIVVDNNSDDSTRELVESFAKNHGNVRLLTEPEQGVVYARNRGFNAAKCEIIGRIDADTRVRPDWAEAAVRYFNNDAAADCAMVTGLSLLYDAPFQNYAARQHRKRCPTPREWPTPSGNNCFILKSAWESIKDSLDTRLDIHEDAALGIRLRQQGWTIMMLPDLVIEMSPRRFVVPPWKGFDYYRAIVRTHEAMGQIEDAKRIRRTMPLVAVVVTGLWIVYGGWDPMKRRWRIMELLTNKGGRVSPVTSSPAAGQAQ